MGSTLSGLDNRALCDYIGCDDEGTRKKHPAKSRRGGAPPQAHPTSDHAGGLNWLSSQKFSVETVLDVGASNGVWSRQCMEFFLRAKYVLFEPQPVHVPELDEFARSNPAVTVVKKAVGASDGHIYFDASVPTGGSLLNDITAPASSSAIKVELTTIDSAVSQLGAKGPFLLKLDTHGFEPSILKGSAATLEKAEILIIEAYCHQVTDEAFLFWQLCGHLAERGFRPVDLVDVMHRPHDNSLWQMDLIFVRSTWPGFNYIHYR
jgi:FkbM family methyltransferase